MRQCVPDAAILVHAGLRRAAGESAVLGALGQASVKCLQAWASFASRVFPGGDTLLAPLQALIPTVLEALTVDEGTFIASMELFADLLSCHRAFIEPRHMDAFVELAASASSDQLHRRIVDGDFSFECLQYGLFLLALGEARMEHLLTARDAPSLRLLELLFGLLGTHGCPVVEDTLFVPTVEFWSSFSECLSDELSLDREGWAGGVTVATSYAARAAERACLKIVFPSDDDVNQWDSAERDGFAEARKDAADLMQAVYSFTGPSLAQSFAEQLPRALAEGAWAEAEAAAFCLGSLAECISGDPTCDGAIGRVFTVELIEYFAPQHSAIPQRSRQGFISLLERFANYFERNTATLPAALNLLFVALRDHCLAGPASKSIHRLCSSCRGPLVPEAAVFLSQYRALFANADVDCLVVERVVGGIACVVQAMEDPDQRLLATGDLLDILCTDFCRHLETACQPVCSGHVARCGPRCLADVAPDDVPVHACLTVLRCLLNLARGLRAEADTPVDVDSGRCPTASHVATSAAVTGLNSRIMAVLAKLQGAFSTSGEVVEMVCQVLRAGFTEVGPGPFVFPSTTVAGHLLSQPLSTRRIGAVVATACAYVNSQAAKNASARGDLMGVLAWVVGLLAKLGDVEADPELAQNGVDFVCRLLIRDASLVMELEPKSLLSSFFAFTINVLDGREPLPKAAAADFWVQPCPLPACSDEMLTHNQATFMSLKPPNDASGMLPLAAAELGPSVTQSLMRNIGGRASRSELDKLSDPVKKMAAQQVMAATWMEAALFHPAFPSQNVSAQDKRTFARKVIR
jgi:hypothetical protein